MTHEERHVGAGEEMARRAAEHPFAEATAAICAHDHKVGLAPRRDFEQGRPDMRVVFMRDFEEPAERLEGTRTILRTLAAIATKKAS